MSDDKISDDKMSKDNMSKQEIAYAKFVEFFCKAGISHIVAAFRLYDTMRWKYDKDIYFHSSLSAKELSDEDAELVIKVIDEEMLNAEPLTELIRKALGDSSDKEDE